MANKKLRAQLGISPIAWWNDDLEELSDDVSLEECLRQAAQAGYTGMENGRRFGTNVDELGPILEHHGISICGGWFSGLLLEGDLEMEKDRIAQQLAFFKAAGAPCIVYGETARSVQGEPETPVAEKPILSESEMAVYGQKLSDFSDWCARQGMPLSYHHHMGAVVQTQSEIDLLMKHSSIPLLFDSGHLVMAGGDCLQVIENYHDRITHVHTKDVRGERLANFNPEKESFLDAVVKGCFTVPGDGSLDFETMIRRLAEKGYEGWFVVEAEQSPVENPPLEMAIKGYNTLQHLLDIAGYQL